MPDSSTRQDLRSWSAIAALAAPAPPLPLALVACGGRSILVTCPVVTFGPKALLYFTVSGHAPSSHQYCISNDRPAGEVTTPLAWIVGRLTRTPFSSTGIITGVASTRRKLPR